MPELTTPERVVALLEWGDVAEADAEIASVAAGVADGEGAGAADRWAPTVWQGMRALMEGRLHACERLARDAGEPAELLMVMLRRDQERLAEAESCLRAVLAGPRPPSGAPALLALLLGEMGRDGLAREEMARLLNGDELDAAGPNRLARPALLAHLAAAVEVADEDLARLERRLRPHASDFVFEDGGAAFYGSVAYALGRLAQARSRTSEAIGWYEDAVAAHERVRAPLWMAHAQRDLAALLRTSGEDGDWERAVEQLRSAATIYQRLAIDGLAAETQTVLARMEGLGVDVLGPDPVFRAQGDVWLVGAPGTAVRLGDARGLRDIARLLAAPGKPLHVTDLLAPVEGQPLLDAPTRAEYETRLSELGAEAVEAERAGDGLRASLARAERDGVAASLAGEDEDGGGGDVFDRARRAVTTRIRISLDHVERADPVVGGHLRASIRTGTFCSYEPPEYVRWDL